jgi:PleD family two-component response regulator
MTLKSIRRHFGRLIHRNQVPALDGIYSTQEFRAILDRERTRVNRNGHEFSLVVFDMGSVSRDSARARRLAHVLSHRVRATDEIGWFDERHIGVALPYTAPESALKVAADICQMMASETLSPIYTVYTYPSRWMAGGGSHDL